MNRRHSEVTAWGLSHISIGTHDTILDVGCGGGMTVRKLAAQAVDGKAVGIDHSEDCVAVSARINREWIDKGRVEILPGTVSQMPFPDRKFDAVVGVDTHPFWPDLPADLREVLRVLKPDGTLLLVTEAYRGGKHDQRLQKLVERMHALRYALLTVDEHRKLLANAGYANVQVFEEYDKGWLCVRGRRPP
jgi:ubiquinone/menaquinone biosynthesis C-methylase UbiE